MFGSRRRITLFATILCAMTAASTANAESPNERALFIYESQEQYFEVFGDYWMKRGDAAAPCDNCESYFVNFNLFKSNSFTPVRTGQKLINANNPEIVGIWEKDKLIGDQMSVSYCPPNATSRKGCWEPLRYIIRNVQTGQVVATKANLPVFGDLYRLVIGNGGQMVAIAERDRPAVLSVIQTRLNDREQERLVAVKAQQSQVEENRHHDELLESDALLLRQSIKIGDWTNCGQVFDVRLPMIGVQTQFGMQFIDVNRLYSPKATCRFRDGVYLGR